MNKNKLLILFILRILLFSLFTISGVLKLYPSIVPFEKQLVDLGFVDWCQAPYFARLIIALELGLGFAFLQSNYLKRIIIPATSLLLVVFCIHLTYTIFTLGANTGNCGCFGQLIPMTPLQALIKNILTLGALGFMYSIYVEKSKNNFLALIILFLVVNLGVFMFYPFCPCNTSSTLDESSIVVPPIVEDSLNANRQFKDSSALLDSLISIGPKKISPSIPKEKLAQKKDTSSLFIEQIPNPLAICPTKSLSPYGSFKRYNDGQLTDLDEGKKLVALFNLECEHCMETAKIIGELAKKRTVPPMYILFWGSEDQVDDFFKAAQYRFPYKIIDPSTFFQLLGTSPSPPKVTYLCNGNTLAEFDNSTFSSEKLAQVLSK